MVVFLSREGGFGNQLPQLSRFLDGEEHCSRTNSQKIGEGKCTFRREDTKMLIYSVVQIFVLMCIAIENLDR